MTEVRGERDGRPSPDALLRMTKDERRGRLRIFLGASPGVGKTYEMLTAARASSYWLTSCAICIKGPDTRWASIRKANSAPI